MATIQDKIAQARAAGYSDDQITSYLANDPQYGPSFQAAQKAGYNSSQILSHFTPADQPTPEAAPAPELKPNNTLGFVVGGSKAFNNVLHWGSKALQAAGVSPDAVHAAGRFLRAAPSLGTSHLMNQDELAALQAQAAQAGYRPGKLGEAGGEVASSIPVAVASLAAAPEVGATGGVAAAGRALAGLGVRGAAVQGAAQGLLNTDQPDNPAAVATDTALGGLGGAVTGGALRLGGAALRPTIDAAAQRLYDAGLPVTLGQIKGGTSRNIEDIKTSVLGLGDLVRERQQAAVHQSTNLPLNRVLNRIGGQLPPDVAPGHDAQQYTEQALRDYLQNITPGLTADISNTTSQPATQFMAGLRNVMDNSGLNLVRDRATGRAMAVVGRDVSHLEPAQQRRLATLINSDIMDQFRAGGGQITGEAARQLDQKLGELAKGRFNQNDMTGQAFGQAAHDLRQHYQGLLEQTSPLAQEYSNYRNAYAQFAPVQKAAAKANEGLYKPTDYARELRSAAGSTAAKAGGRVPNQGLAQDMVSVLSRRIPDSGTAIRTSANNIVRSLGKAVGAIGAPAAVAGGYFAGSAGGHGLEGGLLGGTAAAAALAKLYAPYFSAASSRAAVRGYLRSAATRDAIRQAFEQAFTNPNTRNLLARQLPRSIAQAGTNAALTPQEDYLSQFSPDTRARLGAQ